MIHLTRHCITQALNQLRTVKAQALITEEDQKFENKTGGCPCKTSVLQTDLARKRNLILKKEGNYLYKEYLNI